MPYLQKTPKKRRGNRKNTDNRKARIKVYSTERWKRIRIGYLMAHPTCELCEARGIVTLAVDVHHARSFQLYEGAERLYHAFNAGNLMALCKHCHAWIHRYGATRYTDLDVEAKAADEEFGKGIIPHSFL